MKKTTKLFTTIGLTMVLCLCFSFSALAASFNDTKGHWAEKDIETAAALKLVNGYEDGSFNPDAKISRAEASQIFARLFKLENKAPSTFTDLTDSWCQDAILKGVYAGFINGYENNTFKPSNPITRQEAAKMLGYCVPNNVSGNGLDIFADKNLVDSWAKEYIITVANKKYFVGDNYKNFSPQNSLTRSEAATIVVRAVKAETIDPRTSADDIIAAPLSNVVVSSFASVETVNQFSNTIFSNGLVGLRNATLDGVVVLGKSELDGVVNFKNSKINDATTTGSSVLNFEETLANNLVINAPTTLTGTGFIATVQQNVPAADFKSEIKPQSTIVTPPAVSNNVKVDVVFDNNTHTLTMPYGESDTLFGVMETFIANKDNASVIENNLIAPFNQNLPELKKLKINDTVLYSEDGWNKILQVFEGTSANANSLDMMKPNFAGNATLESLQKSIGGFNSLYKSGATDADRKIMVATLDKMDLTSTSTSGAAVTFNLTAKNTNLTDNKEIAKYLVNNILWTGDTIDTSFDKLGEVKLTMICDSKEISVNVNKIEVKN